MPDSKLKSYEVKLPYVAAVELFKEQIINLLVKMEGCQFNEALSQWFNGYKEFDEKIYSVIKYILKHTKHKNKILLNRNPYLTVGAYQSDLVCKLC